MTGAPVWSVYLVECADGSLYCGTSTDVEARVAAHNEGKGARYTRARRPVTLVYKRRVGTRGDALRRELAIKALPVQDKRKLASAYAVRRKALSRRSGSRSSARGTASPEPV